jgi:hypothetical protein
VIDFDARMAEFAQRYAADEEWRARYLPKHPVRCTLRRYAKKGKRYRALRRELKRFMGDHRRWGWEARMAVEEQP